MNPGVSVIIRDEEYLARYPISALIKAEAELGKPVGSISGSFVEMAIIVKHGLRHPDGSAVTKKEFDGLLDELTVEEFTTVFQTVASAIGGGKKAVAEPTEPAPKSTGKN